MIVWIAAPVQGRARNDDGKGCGLYAVALTVVKLRPLGRHCERLQRLRATGNSLPGAV
jgi:hypothetical protein